MMEIDYEKCWGVFKQYLEEQTIPHPDKYEYVSDYSKMMISHDSFTLAIMKMIEADAKKGTLRNGN
jgi:hypothetical protein